MAEDNTIKLNPNKPTTLEFEVKISGLGETKPIVRFVIHEVHGDTNWMITCASLEDSKYKVSFPAFPDVEHHTRKFSVEVIVDEFFFIPAKGEVVFIGVDDISFKSSAPKRPTVTTSFIVKQDDAPAKVKEGLMDLANVEPPVNPSPVNRLNIEKNPTERDYHKQKSDKSGNKSVPIETIASHVIPGDTKVDNMSAPEDTFDSKQIVANLISNKLGKLQKPTTKGSLFARSSNGKTLIAGLEDQETQQELDNKASKVKEILNSI